MLSDSPSKYHTYSSKISFKNNDIYLMGEKAGITSKIYKIWILIEKYAAADVLEKSPRVACCVRYSMYLLPGNGCHLTVR